MEQVCDERHERIDSRLRDNDGTLREHGNKIGEIERACSRYEANIIHICETLKGLTKSIYGLTTALVVSLVGFFIWYVQSIPR